MQNAGRMRQRRKKSEMPFADALAAAEKRMKQATKERDSAFKTLASLDVEIPALQNTILALTSQLGEKVVMPIETRRRQSTESETVAATGEHRAETSADLLTEDDTLPEPDGQPVTPED